MRLISKVIFNLHRFFALNREEKRLFIEAAVTLYKTKLLLQIISFKRLRALCAFDASNRLEDSFRTSSDQFLCRQSVMRAKKLILWKKSICLVDALSLQSMLSKRGISSTLHLGIAMEGNQMSAHAWLEKEGRDLIGKKGKEQFTSIASFSSKMNIEALR